MGRASLRETVTTQPRKSHPLEPRSLLKNYRVWQEWEGHEFHSCRKSYQLNNGFSRWGKARQIRTLFQQAKRPFRACPELVEGAA